MTDLIEKIYRYLEHNTGSFNMVLEVIPPVLAAALIYFLIRRHWQKKSLGSEFKAKREAAFWNEFIRLLLVCSVCAIIFIGVFPYNFWRKLYIIQSHPLRAAEEAAGDTRPTLYHG